MNVFICNNVYGKSKVKRNPLSKLADKLFLMVLYEAFVFKRFPILFCLMMTVTQSASCHFIKKTNDNLAFKIRYHFINAREHLLSLQNKVCGAKDGRA